MSTFIYVVTALFVLELVCKIVCLSLDCIPERTRGGILLDALAGLAIAGWGVYLLAK